MRYLVLSDTHGAVSEAVRVFRATRDIDRIIHLGDTYRDALAIAEMTGKPVTCVKGNMDGSYDPDGYEILETEWGKIFLSHGHMESVKSGYEEIVSKAMTLGCRAAFCGHTHLPEYEQLPDGFIVLNPGSLGRPAGGRKGTYAVATIDSDFRAMILAWDGEPPRKKANGSADEHFAVRAGFRR